MASAIKIKRSAVQGKVPSTTDLQLGELAVNTYDGKLFLKKDNGTESVVEIGKDLLTTETDDRILFDQQLTEGVAYATDLAGHAVHGLTLKQDLDSDLTAIAALSATGLIERTGVGAAGTVTITSAGKAILDDANAGEQRTTLGAAAAAELGTEIDNRALYDEELARAVTYATDIAGQAARVLSGCVPAQAPASASSPGVAGQIRYANGYLYVCVASNSWQRVAIATWS